jgi:hypothetical protein
VSQATVYVDANSVAELKAIGENMELRLIEGGRLTLGTKSPDASKSADPISTCRNN